MSKEEQVTQLTEHMAKFIAHVAKKLPDDVIAKLEQLRDKEDSPLSKTIYDTMFKNQELAVKLNRPSCQDTGVLQFWVKCGTKFPLIGELEALLKDSVVTITNEYESLGSVTIDNTILTVGGEADLEDTTIKGDFLNVLFGKVFYFVILFIFVGI